MEDSNRIIVDSAAFYALASDEDAFHQRAQNTYYGMLNANKELWTTSYAMVETMALIQRRLGFRVLVDFMDDIGRNVSVFWVAERTHNQAWDRLVEQQGAGLNFVDWTVALLSERLDAVIFTFDGGFVNRGYSVIPRMRA